MLSNFVLDKMSRTKIKLVTPFKKLVYKMKTIQYLSIDIARLKINLRYFLVICKEIVDTG